MARQLHLKQISLSTSEAGGAAFILLSCAFALFMCASHSRRWRLRRWSTCYGSYNHDLFIQPNTEDVTLGTGVHDIQAGSRDDSTFSGEQGVAVWKKNILMGGRCQLPDFSGVIIYDSDGKVVTSAKNPRPLLTLK